MKRGDWVRWAGCSLFGAVLALQPGGGSSVSRAVEHARASGLAGMGSAMSRLLDQVTARAKDPVTAMPRRVTPPSDTVWVPDRFVPIPGVPGVVRVPAHWERRISGSESYVPPLVIIDPTEAKAHVIPGGVRPSAELRNAL